MAASLHISVKIIEKIIICSRAVKLAARGPHMIHQFVLYLCFSAPENILPVLKIRVTAFRLFKQTVNVLIAYSTGAFGRRDYE
jgi:hypothetical protein